MPRSIQQLLIRDTAKFSVALLLEIGSARIEVQSLLQHVLQVSRAYLLAHPERKLAGHEYDRYHTLRQRRLLGEPLAYILGEREFFGLAFGVTPATLVPRPETELLVELALQRIPSPPTGSAPLASLSPQAGEGGRQAGRGSAFRVLDLGTGCGAIAVSIAHARPDVEVIAVDASAAALVVAYENAKHLLEPACTEGKSDPVQAIQLANLGLLQSDWFEQIATQRFDLIVSNPPYVASGDPHLQQGDLRFEPASALASGADGLDDIRLIVKDAPAHLHPGGWLMLEHGYDQAAAVRRLLQDTGLNKVFSACDLAGIERVSGGQLA